MGIFGLKLCRVIIYCNFHLFVSIRVASVNYIQLDSEVLRTQKKNEIVLATLRDLYNSSDDTKAEFKNLLNLQCC